LQKVALDAGVKNMAEFHNSGYSRKEIADYLNNQNILIPKLYKKSSNEIVMSEWNSEIINRLLRNETYIGNLVQGRKRKQSYRTTKIIDVNKDRMDSNF